MLTPLKQTELCAKLASQRFGTKKIFLFYISSIKLNRTKFNERFLLNPQNWLKLGLVKIDGFVITNEQLSFSEEIVRV